MKVAISKIVWSIVALACIAGLVYIWLIGLPVPNYVAIDDGASAETYTIQVSPNHFFDVQMSKNEVLKNSDWETTYIFEDASVRKSSTSKSADLINADKQIYGRPNSFCYRKFTDTCTITVDSELSTYQGFKSLQDNEVYTVYGDMTKQHITSMLPPTLPDLPTYDEVADGIFANQNYVYDYDEDTSTMLWLSAGEETFYKASKTFGLMGDVTQQLLATAKACYKLDLTEYYAGDDYYMWLTNRWVLGVKRINRNTQLVVATNSLEQFDAAIYTITR